MRSSWLAEAAPPALGGIAEAAWLGVYAAAVGTQIGGASTAGSLVVLLIAALSGVAAGRWLPFARWRPAAIFALAVLAVLVAMSISQGSELGSTNALQRPLGALLVGLAALRGVVHGEPDAGDRAIGGLVRLSPLLLSGGWLLGFAGVGDARPAFVAEAFDASLLFIMAAALGLGSARLLSLTVKTRRTPGTDRAWLVLVSVVAGSAALGGLPVAALIGLPLARAITSGLIGLVLIFVGAILGTIGALGALVGWLLAAFVGPVADRPSALPMTSPAPGEPLPPTLAATGADATIDLVGPLLGVLLLVALVGTAWYLAVRWQGARRVAKPVADVSERRSIVWDLSIGLPALRVPARLRTMQSPRGALDAYLRLLDDWSMSDRRARRASETPAAHARRLRSEGNGDLGFDLLVADFELTRFGEVALTAHEERRAVGRWRRLRRPIRRARGPAPVHSQ